MTEISSQSKSTLYDPQKERLRIAPSRGWAALRLGELWRFRELLYFLTWRDIKVRYKQTVLGALWAILQPFLTMVVFSLFFGRLANIDSDGIAYPIFVYTGLLPWNYFAQSLGQSAVSLVGNANLITRVYFPRLIMPLSNSLSPLVDFCIAFLVLAGMMVYFSVSPTSGVLFLPLFILLAMVTSLGAGVWLAALNVHFRDIRYAVPFIVQLWFFSTPVVYPASLLEEPWRTLYGLNPMVGVVEGFRWALLGKADPPGLMVAVSAVAAVLILISGLFYFRRMERTFADVV